MPPTALLETLRTIGQRVRAYAVAIGISRLAASAVGLLAAIVFIDWAAHFTGAAPGGLPGAIRLLLELTAFGVLAAAAVVWVVRPASRKLSLSDVAGRIEDRYPQFGDTLRSTVNFLSGNIPGSESMKKLVVGQAAERMGQADISAVVNTRPVVQSAAVATASVFGLVILAILVGPAFRHVAFSWLIHPLSGEVWPKTVQIAVDSGTPTRIAAGEQVPVKIRLTRGDRSDRRVTIRYRYDEGRWQEQVMDRGPDGAYAASLDSRLEEGRKTGAMQIEVAAGDDEIALAPLTIVPRLDLAGIEASVTAPAYVRASSQSRINLTERPAVMAYGSTVDLALHFNKPLAKNAPVDIQPTNPGMKLLGVTWDRPSPETAVAHFPADASFRFTVHATDEDNFKNLGAAEFEMIVREDTPPTVQIEEPRRSEDRTAAAEFPLKAVAEDDYGILDAQLIVQRITAGSTTRPSDAKTPDTQPSGENHWTLNLVQDNTAGMGANWRETGGSADRKRYELTYDWDLAKLENANLKPGDVLEYFVQVKDNFNLSGRQHEWVPSGKLRVTIISQEQFTAAVQAALQNIHGQLGELLRGQIRNKTETDALKQLTSRKQQFDQADRVQADRIASEQSNTASQTMQIAGRLADMAQKIQENKASDPALRQTADAARQQLQNTAEGSMKEAARSLSNARDQKGPDASRPGQQQRGQQDVASPDSKNTGAQSDQQNGQQAGQNPTSDPKNADAMSSADSKNGEKKNGDQKSADQKAADQKSADQKSADQKSADQKSGDAKPSDAKAGDQKSADQKPGNQGGQNKSNSAKPGQNQNGQPQSGQPQSGDPQAGQPQSGQPQNGQPQSGQPQSGQPKADQQAQADQQPDKKPLSKEAVARDTSMQRASENQAKAADEIRNAMDRLGNFDGLSDFRNKLTEIRAKQENLQSKYNKAAKGQLGKKPEEMAKEKQDELKKIADEQKQLSDQTRKTLDDMAKKADQMTKSDQNAAQAMKAAAQTGNDQQVPGKQDQASQAMQQNQQGQAEQDQQMAQIGLQMVIAKLTEAERRKLEELQAKLADAKQLVEDLVRRQAGHNLDNLLLQGGDVLKKMETADRDTLIDNSQRDPKLLQEARTIRDLDTSQRVTERNARDVAKKCEELPDPAPAAKITVAAGDMERAIVSLNNEKLPEAYEPPQFEALAALVEARDLIDKALAKTQEQLKEQQKDTIRAAYQKLLVDQKKIGDDILSIDTATKKGALPRPTAIRLGQLPGDQGGVADRTDKLGEQLAQLDSVVYVWANTDMVKTMRQVKDDLAKPDTTIVTQAEETRIEDQLQAMIDSLKVKPKQSKFNERQQGGDKGGQQGKPKVRMPSEAELQLLKALQVAVNKSTATIAKEAQKDKPRISSLGGRQGDLRELLDKMVQKATDGQTKLGPEPDNRDQLPEEAKKDDVEAQELVTQLLNDKLTDDQSANSIKLTGDRMARSRQRLALNTDPGKVTQEIQKRIVIDIDSLIQQAQNQQAQQKPGKPQPGKGQQPRPGQQGGQQQVAQGQQQQQGGKNAAQQSTLTQGDARIVDTHQNLKEEMQEWGKLHPRDRDAIVEAGNEKVNPKYQKLVDDYYKTLSDKSTEQNR